MWYIIGHVKKTWTLFVQVENKEPICNLMNEKQKNDLSKIIANGTTCCLQKFEFKANSIFLLRTALKPAPFLVIHIFSFNHLQAPNLVKAWFFKLHLLLLLVFFYVFFYFSTKKFTMLQQISLKLYYL